MLKVIYLRDDLKRPATQLELQTTEGCFLENSNSRPHLRYDSPKQLIFRLSCVINQTDTVESAPVCVCVGGVMFIQLFSNRRDSSALRPHCNTGLVNQPPAARTDSYTQFGFIAFTHTRTARSAGHLNREYRTSPSLMKPCGNLFNSQIIKINSRDI